MAIFKKLSNYSLLICNLAMFLYSLIICFSHITNSITNFFGWLIIALLIIDVIYLGFVRRKYSIFVLTYIALAILIHHLCNMNLSPKSGSSYSVVATLFLCSAFLVISAYIMIGMFKKNLKTDTNKLLKIVYYSLAAVAPIVLFVFALLAFDYTMNYGYSDNEYTTTRANFVFLFTAICLLAGAYKSVMIFSGDKIIKKLFRLSPYLIITTVMAGYVISSFAMPMFLIEKDITAGEKQFISAFGDMPTNKAFRQSGFNMSDMFFGIPTKDYAAILDVEYLSEEGGFNLRYDAYYPNGADSHKSVMIFMHGRNGDKGNSKEKCRYFAAQGYVVFDIQVGDGRESGTNVNTLPSETVGDYQFMSDNINKFIKYASTEKRFGENWQSVFISGGSMGANLTIKSMFDNEFNYQDINVNIKGILPIYPSPNVLDIDVIKEKNVPCLILMGTHDESAPAAYRYQDYYAQAGMKECAIVWSSYAAHGCDQIFSGRSNQSFIYFMERFMEKYR